MVAKIEWRAGELFPRVGSVVTNRTDPARGVVRFYNGRATCEQWIKEGQYALEWMRRSYHEFNDNGVPVAVFVLGYNLGNPIAILDRLQGPASLRLRAMGVPAGAARQQVVPESGADQRERQVV